MSNVEDLLENCHLTEDNIEIKNTDDIKYLKEIANNSIDLVLKDPSYIISRESGMNTF
jgi:exoribonuclease II